MDDVFFKKRCAMCPDEAVYSGPLGLSNAKVFCGETCERLYDAVTPGEWVDASQLMRGGRHHDRPDIWS